MLRYFVSANCWLFVSLCLILGRGYARHSPDYYTLFGWGWIEPWIFQLSVTVACTASALCLWVYLASCRNQAKSALTLNRENLDS